MVTRVLPLMLLALAVLPGCNAGSQAAAAKDSPSLRIVMRMHPEPQRMLEQIESRMGLCRLELRAKGVEAAALPMPSPAQVAKWVTRETEDIYAKGRHASFSTDVMVWPNAEKGCQLTFYKTVHAETETLCADWYAGSAKAEPVQGGGKPPEFSEEKTPGDDAQRCLAKATKKSRDDGMPKGTAAGGQACLWLSESAPGGEPNTPGQHFCVHPRAYDGSLPKFRNGAEPTLRYKRVLPPGAKPGPTPEVDADRMEAEIVEEGKPIADDRFSRAAVEAFVRQALVVPAGGQQ